MTETTPTGVYQAYAQAFRAGPRRLGDRSRKVGQARAQSGRWPSLATLSPAEQRLLDQSPIRETLIENIMEGLRDSDEGLIEDVLSWPRSLNVNAADIGCPVMAIHGTDDDWQPLQNLRRIIERIPSANL